MSIQFLILYRQIVSDFATETRKTYRLIQSIIVMFCFFSNYEKSPYFSQPQYMNCVFAFRFVNNHADIMKLFSKYDLVGMVRLFY